ncbi:MAG: YifB family Mg chelatase-like AAA ATPase [Coriobacteriia bacterium]|nr:YifB family Mg chelatase-like AAA ATPase [Coriobacteriia bacterium]
MMRGRTERMACVNTATINGVETLPVTVEVSIGSGLPGISIVGMPDLAVQEARLRVRLALIAAGFEVPQRHVVVNLAPSSLKKIGSGFDLPIALGILIATEQLAPELIGEYVCVGELSLDGSVRPVKGLLAYEKHAHEAGFGLLTAPVEQGVYELSESEHFCIASLADLHTGEFMLPNARTTQHAEMDFDFCEIDGNDVAKRALQIAAAGSHGILLVGPPGSGKSMMAARLPTILPPLDKNERIESAMIHSVAGLSFDGILAGFQPFRSPHHSASQAGLMGGGSPASPGEVSLAHSGVLFLDEMPEFGNAVLQMLRQPIETGLVSLARARGTVVFPARFLLVGAANPCPCGYYGDAQHACRCTPAQITNYQGRIGGPLMDRFDLIVKVWRSDPTQVLRTGKGTSSMALREGVLQARAYREKREAAFAEMSEDMLTHKGKGKNKSVESVAKPVEELAAHVGEVGDVSEVYEVYDGGEEGEACDGGEVCEACEKGEAPTGKGARLIASCFLGAKELSCLEDMARHYHLSGRGIMRALAVARTIADIEQQEKVSNEHLLEAITFRADGEDGL